MGNVIFKEFFSKLQIKNRYEHDWDYENVKVDRLETDGTANKEPTKALIGFVIQCKRCGAKLGIDRYNYERVVDNKQLTDKEKYGCISD